MIPRNLNCTSDFFFAEFLIKASWYDKIIKTWKVSTWALVVVVIVVVVVVVVVLFIPC